jgi:hypothetical protein
MAKRSKITDEPETVRPSIGIGTGNSGGARVALPPDVAKLVTRINPAEYVAGAVTRALARETAGVLLNEHVRTLMKVMGLDYRDAAAVTKELAVLWNHAASDAELHAHAADDNATQSFTDLSPTPAPEG